MKCKSIILVSSIVVSGACHNQAGDPTTAAAAKSGVPAAVQPGAQPADSNKVILSAEQAKNAGIELGDPQTREIHSTIKVSGTLEAPPENIVSVSMPLGGYVKKMTLIPGERVGKGGVLAILEDPQYIQLQQDYLTAKSRIQYLEADYQRQKGLNETKATSDKVLQQVQSEYNSQKILVASLGEKLRLIGIRPESLHDGNITRAVNIYSPIDGYVTKVNVNMGRYVSPTDVLFELVDPGELHLTLIVFQNDAAYLHVGQKIVCFTNNQPEKQYSAIIHLITPSIGQNGSTEVHCHLAKYGRELMPGMYMNAAIELNKKKVTAVPEEAVVKWEKQYFVFSQETGEQYRMVPVKIGASDGGFVEVASALPAGRIVMKNAYTILMKMKNSGEE